MSRIAYVELDGGPWVACRCPADLAIHKGDPCIIEADRVLDFGHIVVLEDSTGNVANEKKAPKVLRRATLQDHAKANENTLMNKMAMKTCLATAEKYRLKMRLARVRYSLDRAVLMVRFNAEERVDFREMVNELAGELRTRVEMKEIGVRDQAGIVGGLGPCGRRLCCSTWLHHFGSINVKMAKDQNLSLNPGVITGMCGRLKCCLSYECDHYKELGRRMPSEGDGVQCPDGKGYVTNINILGQRVRVRLEDDRVLEYGVDKIEQIRMGKERNRRLTDEHSSAERAEPEPARKARARRVRRGRS